MGPVLRTQHDSLSHAALLYWYPGVRVRGQYQAVTNVYFEGMLIGTVKKDGLAMGAYLAVILAIT